MSQTVQVKERILGAIDQLEYLQSSGISLIKQTQADKSVDESDDDDAETSENDGDNEAEVIEGLRSSLRKSRVKSVNLRAILDKERQEYREEINALGESIDTLRASYAALSQQHEDLQQALKWGDVDVSAIDKNMAAELDTLRAERAVERQELLTVQRQLEALLQLDDILETEVNETEQSGE